MVVRLRWWWDRRRQWMLWFGLTAVFISIIAALNVVRTVFRSIARSVRVTVFWLRWRRRWWSKNRFVCRCWRRGWCCSWFIGRRWMRRIDLIVVWLIVVVVTFRVSFVMASTIVCWFIVINCKKEDKFTLFQANFWNSWKRSFYPCSLSMDSDPGRAIPCKTRWDCVWTLRGRHSFECIQCCHCSHKSDGQSWSCEVRAVDLRKKIHR